MPLLDENALRALLSPAQLPAVLHIEGPSLILAGAGSGKTRTLTYKIAHLISAIGVDPARILAVTFTNKAAAEMRERLAVYLEERIGLPWMGTFHSLCVRILRQVLPNEPRVQGRGEGWSRNFSIYDDDDQKKLLNQILKEWEAEVVRKGGLPTALPEVKELRGVISHWKGRMYSPAEAEKNASWERERLVARLYARYVDRMRESNALDFDDLMGLVVRMFESEPDLAYDWSSWFQFRFVDEYQDTNPLQYRLLKLLCGWHPRRDDQEWRHVNITAVGDDDQGIYSWRGADITILRDFAHDFDMQQGRIFKLEQNYRSTRCIVEAAGSVIAKNPKEEHLKKVVFSEGDEGDRVRILRMNTDRDEAELIAREIKVRGEARYPQTAVFYRTNAQSRTIEEALRRANIPYKVIGGFSFYERKEVKDVLAYLKVILNPRDGVSLGRILNYPPRNIGKQKETALQLWATANECGLWDALGQAESILGESCTPVRDFRLKLAQWMERAEAQDLATTLDMVLQESRLLSYLEGRKDEEEAIANVKELMSSVVEALENDPTLDLGGFLQQVSLQTSADEEPEVDGVQLMTIHGSKGLEFDFVYISGCEEGFMPMQRAGEDAHEEEERRLFYVGMTRAKQQLALMHTQVRRIFGRDDFCRRPSPFLDEIDPRYVEIVDRSGRTASFSGRFGEGSGYSSPRSSEAPPKRVVLRRSTADELGEGQQIGPGMSVEHARFGSGRILKVSGNGPEAKVEVRFADGARTLVWKYANLRVLGHED